MTDAEERMQAKDATNPKNSTNDNRARKSGVTLTYKRKSSYKYNSNCPEPEPKPEPKPRWKRQRKQQHLDSLQPTLKRAAKRTPRKKVQFRHVNVEEPVSESTDLSLITTRSWSGLLRHRMALGGFLTFVERLEYEQLSAIVEARFGEILSIRTKLIPKKLARWLLKKYDPWDNSLNLANGKLLIDEDDVYATLGLPIGELELFYMDRVQLRGRKVERSFPVAINSDTEKVRNRDKDEQLLGEYGKGRIIERIDYQIIMRLAEVDLDINMQELARGQPHQGGTSEISRARAKSIAREEIQHRKRVACIPPSFSLGISLEQEATPALSAQPTPGTIQERIPHLDINIVRWPW
ncbi:hypothetical protein Cgig2_021230 [Carnegiea gigantea]|uniref:Uncharacterized protein n=1 Tax=Carnegiea gigantea TaxID=171969 RepID=A0A9Q1KWD0_9CARY|nr:hypothetical protein Cgig2_021230 [Carnegiea gigantea]